MLRGLPHLCKYMPKPKDARRLIPDPENEPDFYAISKVYPLPDDEAARNRAATRPSSADEMPEVGTPRSAFHIFGLADQLMPPAKRSRTSSTEAASSVGIAGLPGNTAAEFIAKLASPNISNNGIALSIAASSLASANNSLFPTAASSLTGTNSTFAVGSANGLPLGDALSAFRGSQVQAATDRNSAVLAALRTNTSLQTPPVPRTGDLAATLAAALLQQTNGNTSCGGSSLTGFFGRRF